VLDKTVLLYGTLFGGFCVLSGMYFGEYSQMSVFFVSLIVICSMLYYTTESMPNDVKGKFLLACAAIFLFRIVPGVGPGFRWWIVGDLHFDRNFLGTLRIISNISSMAVLWILSSTIAKGRIFYSMMYLIVIGTIMSIPELFVYYDMHTMVGLTARQVFMFDTGIEAPLGGLSMIPLGVLIAKNAPPTQRAVYISLTASFMNVALVGGDIITKRLNTFYVITRTDFSELGILMIVSLTISTLLSILGLYLLRGER
jgi:hypothetical protein